MRIRLDIDETVLQDLKRLQQREGKSLGRLASDLLAHALAQRAQPRSSPPPFAWNSSASGLRVDLAHRDAMLDAMEGRKP